MLKRFLLFSGSDHHPRGGWRDFKGSFDTRAEAEAATATDVGWTWFQVVNTCDLQYLLQLRAEDERGEGKPPTEADVALAESLVDRDFDHADVGFDGEVWLYFKRGLTTVVWNGKAFEV